ncbi:MAG: tRNA lysidine(34) synthetase TilS [Fusobacteria bacterium]|nr:tRNA lysidine(34) synthetase TilS [Fusobacteriota bacterium]
MYLLDSQENEKKTIVKNVIEDISKYKLIEEGDSVLIGFSGGPDSRFLLEVLRHYQKSLYFSITLCHINHNLRVDAKNDENFCRELASKLHLPIYVLSIDVEKLSRERKESIELCAREVRYQYFNEILEKEKISKIATAHHLNDNVETFLYRFSRGSSIYGLRGMSLQEGIKIRPLIHSQKKNILEYLHENDIMYCSDLSNLENIYTRNKIRNKVVPLLEKIEINTQVKISHIQDELSQIHEDIEKFLPSPIIREGLSLHILKKFTPYVAKYFISKECFKYRISLSRTKLEQIYLSIFKEGTLKHEVKKYFVIKEYAHLRVEEKNKFQSEAILFRIGNTQSYNGYEISSCIASKKEKKAGSFYLALSKLQGKKIVIRSREEGDYIVPQGMNSKKKLKEVMINDKIPLRLRERVPLLCCEKEVIAMFSRRVSQNYVVLGGTEECVELIIKEES